MEEGILTKNSLIAMAIDVLDKIIETKTEVRIEMKCEGASLSPYSDKIGRKHTLSYYMGKQASLRETHLTLSVIDAKTEEDRGFLSLDFEKIKSVAITKKWDRVLIIFDNLEISH